MSINPLRGRFIVGGGEFHVEGDTTPDALEKQEVFELPVPTGLKVFIYTSIPHKDYVAYVTLHAMDVDYPTRPGYFASRLRYSNYPSREQLLDQITDMLRHEMMHRLGMNAHPEKSDDEVR